jgi:hypothetical protein
MSPIDLNWLEALRWPLVLALLAAGLYFWRRGPERREPWEPPEEPAPATRERPADTSRREPDSSDVRDATANHPESAP